MTTSTIWRLPDVVHHTGLSRSTIYEMIQRNEFPRQVRLGKRAVGWMAEDITTWISSRVDASSDAEAVATVSSSVRG